MPAAQAGGHGSSNSRRWTGFPAAVVDQVHELLAQADPRTADHRHRPRDYRLDNTVLDETGTWWPSRLGDLHPRDPLADLGLLMVYWAEPGTRRWVWAGVAPTTMPGFATRSDSWIGTPPPPGWMFPVSPTTWHSVSGSSPVSCRVCTSAMQRPAAGDRSGVDQFAASVGKLGERHSRSGVL